VQDCLERAVSRWHQRREGNTHPGSSPFCITSRQSVRQSAAPAGIEIDETNEETSDRRVQEQKLMYQDF